MKQKVSFLATIAIALSANCVRASECIGEDCELTPIEFVETTESVDELIPTQYEINWTVPSEYIEESVCEYDYNCPFETAAECAIWYKKPIYTTTVAPRAPHINPIRVDDMIYAIYSKLKVSGNDDAMQPLTQRYHMLMNASSACCTSGIIYKMRENGADDMAVYQFLKDDANRFAITKRCLVMDDSQITQKYSNGVTGQMLADVRNACLCKNHKWFESLLQPFNDIYDRAPEFERKSFDYTYIDGMQREITVSVNDDVQKAIGMLSACPK